jgi:5-methylcytosine-specific restriction enzyme subunit McrC
LPKIAKGAASVEDCRKSLIKMLVCLKDSPFKQGGAASLRSHQMSVFEIIMKYFLDEVVHIVKKGVVRNYISEQGNLKFLRGKLLLNENTKKNVANRANFYCMYDEFATDIPINRLIKSALSVVSKISSNPQNIQSARELASVFKDVGLVRDSETEYSNIVFDRTVQHYLPAMPSCMLILRGENVLTQVGDSKVFSLLFPMQRVFEDYVTVQLSKQFPRAKIKSQIRSKFLIEAVGEHARKMFNLRPDIQIDFDEFRVIADTKWKLVNSLRSQSKFGIKEADMYQLFAYGKKYLDEHSGALVLVYPKTINFSKPLATFWYNGDKSLGLYVLPYDLENDQLLMSSELLSKIELL